MASQITQTGHNGVGAASSSNTPGGPRQAIANPNGVDFVGTTETQKAQIANLAERVLLDVILPEQTGWTPYVAGPAELEHDELNRVPTSGRNAQPGTGYVVPPTRHAEEPRSVQTIHSGIRPVQTGYIAKDKFIAVDNLPRAFGILDPPTAATPPSPPVTLRRVDGSEIMGANGRPLRVFYDHHGRRILPFVISKLAEGWRFLHYMNQHPGIQLRDFVDRFPHASHKTEWTKHTNSVTVAMQRYREHAGGLQGSRIKGTSIQQSLKIVERIGIQNLRAGILGWNVITTGNTCRFRQTATVPSAFANKAGKWGQRIRSVIPNWQNEVFDLPTPPQSLPSHLQRLVDRLQYLNANHSGQVQGGDNWRRMKAERFKALIQAEDDRVRNAGQVVPALPNGLAAPVPATLGGTTAPPQGQSNQAPLIPPIGPYPTTNVTQSQDGVTNAPFHNQSLAPATVQNLDQQHIVQSASTNIIPHSITPSAAASTSGQCGGNSSAQNGLFNPQAAIAGHPPNFGKHNTRASSPPNANIQQSGSASSSQTGPSTNQTVVNQNGKRRAEADVEESPKGRSKRPRTFFARKSGVMQSGDDPSSDLAMLDSSHSQGQQEQQDALPGHPRVDGASPIPGQADAPIQHGFDDELDPFNDILTGLSNTGPGETGTANPPSTVLAISPADGLHQPGSGNAARAVEGDQQRWVPAQDILDSIARTLGELPEDDMPLESRRRKNTPPSTSHDRPPDQDAPTDTLGDSSVRGPSNGDTMTRPSPSNEVSSKSGPNTNEENVVSPEDQSQAPYTPRTLRVLEGLTSATPPTDTGILHTNSQDNPEFQSDAPFGELSTAYYTAVAFSGGQIGLQDIDEAGYYDPNDPIFRDSSLRHLTTPREDHFGVMTQDELAQWENMFRPGTGQPNQSSSSCPMLAAAYSYDRQMFVAVDNAPPPTAYDVGPQITEPSTWAGRSSAWTGTDRLNSGITELSDNPALAPAPAPTGSRAVEFSEVRERGRRKRSRDAPDDVPYLLQN